MSHRHPVALILPPSTPSAEVTQPTRPLNDLKNKGHKAGDLYLPCKHCSKIAIVDNGVR